MPNTTRLTQYIGAPPAEVYRALIDAEAVATWMVPDGMTSQVHDFNAHEGGTFRISLTYDDPGWEGKSAENTDTYHGHFVKLEPHKHVVQVMAFESDDPAMQGEMTSTFTLTEAAGGTDVEAVHEDVPAGIRPEDNEMGWRISLGKLARLVEAG